MPDSPCAICARPAVLHIEESVVEGLTSTPMRWSFCQACIDAASGEAVADTDNMLDLANVLTRTLLNARAKEGK